MHVKKGMFRHIRVCKHERALSEVVQKQAGEDEKKPCRHDRPTAEMAQVHIERLRPCDRKKYGSQDSDRVPDIARGIENAMKRVEGTEDF